MRWIAAALAVGILAAPAAGSGPVAGLWRTADKDGLVRIGDCGASVCGQIARFLVPPPQGLDQRDVNNPNAEMRRRKLLGLPVLSGFKADGKVWRGTIYDPKTGKSYRSVLRRLDADRLEVKGCVGPLCRTQIWRKAE